MNLTWEIWSVQVWIWNVKAIVKKSLLHTWALSFEKSMNFPQKNLILIDYDLKNVGFDIKKVKFDMYKFEFKL